MKHRTIEIGALGIGWMAAWGTLGGAVSIVAGIVDPGTLDPGEGPVDLARKIGSVGGGTGIVFGLLLSIAERGKTIAEASLPRALLLGIVAGAVVPLLLPSIENAVITNTCPLAALSAVLSVTLARFTERFARALA